MPTLREPDDNQEETHMNHYIVTTAALLALGVTLCGSGCGLVQPSRAAGAVTQRVERAVPQVPPSWEPEE